jgi:hypothetical protein
MRRIFFFLLVACTLSLVARAQQNPAQKPAEQPQPAPTAAPQSLSSRVPPANPADVNSIVAIMAAIYDVISGPPGTRDWNRFRSLFVPEARLTSTTKSATSSSVRLLAVDDYVNRAGKYFTTHGFFESAIVNHVERFGNIAQVFSSYESRNAANDKPFVRGVNSIQLFNDGGRWWVLSILWDEESPTNPLPADMATRPPAPDH